MLRFIAAQLRRRAGRTAALLAGVLVATTGFTVLTGSTATSRLVVTGTVDSNHRAAYDILIRPAGSRSGLEGERELVRPSFLSSQFGGITMAQWRQIQGLAGVEVAAPIAMVGYTATANDAWVDLTDGVDRSLTRQTLRIGKTWSTDRGLSTLAEDRRVMVYVTKRPVAWPTHAWPGQGRPVRYSDGVTRPYAQAALGCGSGPVQFGVLPLEIQEDGSALPVCSTLVRPEPSMPSQEPERLVVVQLGDDGAFNTCCRPHGRQGEQIALDPLPSERLMVPVAWPTALLTAAIDPEQEARLVGVDAAMVKGSYFRDGGAPYDVQLPPHLDGEEIASGATAGPQSTRVVPVIATSRPYVDEQLAVTVERVTETGVVAGVDGGVLRGRLLAAPGVATGITARYDINDQHRRGVDELVNATARDGGGGLYGSPSAEGGLSPVLPFAQFTLMVEAGAPSYDPGTGQALRVGPVDSADEVWHARDASGVMAGWPRPPLSRDTAYRPLQQARTPSGATVVAQPVGMFDPDKLRGFSDLSRVPMETYQAPTGTGADEPSRRLLGNRALLPSGNPGGYLTAPPLMLTTLSALPALTTSDRPLSAVRVRVAGVTTFDEVSRERVRVVAEQITTLTGLDVDITFGSSPVPQTVELPGGRYGRPELRLTEHWSKLGVATAIIDAVDRKSVALFGLILVVCVLFLANAVSASVRDRRSQLAILTCLGWPPGRITTAILGEVGLVGLAGGLAATGLTLPIARLIDVQLSLAHAALAAPVALGLALAAATVPAIRAARTNPAVGLRPAVAPVHRARRCRTIAGLALANLARTRGRTVLGAGALAIGVAALTLLAAITFAFRGAVVGTALGDAVSLRVRGVDTIAVAATVVLAAAAIADVLYLNIRERAAEIATLRATGWSPAALVRLVAYEGLGIGALGASLGAATGLAATGWFVGTLPPSLVTVAIAAAVLGTLLAGLAALVPALLLRFIPITTLLAED
jgi:hypothetical protein